MPQVYTTDASIYLFYFSNVTFDHWFKNKMPIIFFLNINILSFMGIQSTKVHETILNTSKGYRRKHFLRTDGVTDDERGINLVPSAKTGGN